MLVTILLNIFSLVSCIIFGVLIGLIILLVIRDDLAAKFASPNFKISDLLSKKNEKKWSEVLESLQGEPVVPPTVQLQVIANQLSEFSVERLDPLNIKLKKAIMKMDKLLRFKRKLQVAHKFERIQLFECLKKISDETDEKKTVATSTHNLIDFNGINLEENKNYQADKTELAFLSTNSLNTSINRSFSKQLINIALSLFIWSKNTYSTLVIQLFNFIKFVWKICKFITSNSEYMKTILNFTIDIVKKFIQVNATVNTANEKTILSVIIFPDNSTLT